MTICPELNPNPSQMYEIYMAIVDGKHGDVEHHCNQCIQLALFKWTQLPPVATADCAHNSLLMLFHQLVEVHESCQVSTSYRFPTLNLFCTGPPVTW
jgi:hypothetical protein